MDKEKFKKTVEEAVRKEAFQIVVDALKHTHITALGREKLSVAKISVTRRELDALRYVISQMENYEFNEPQNDGEIPVAIGVSVEEMDALIDLGKEVRKISSDLLK
jgi:hypothetical protein